MAQEQTAPEIAEPDWDEGEPECKIPDPYEGFHIDTDDKADWYMGKIGALIDEKKRFTAAYEARAMKYASAMKSLMRRFDAEFEHYMTKRVAAIDGATVILDHGPVSLREVARSVAVADAEKAADYCRKNNLAALLSQKTELNKSAYSKLAKKALDGDGEVLPGIRVTAAHKSFTYEGREEGIKLLAKEDAGGDSTV